MDSIWFRHVLHQLLLGLGAVLGSFSLVFGQGVDIEPNSTCQEAQDFGAVMLPFMVEGSLDTPPETPDVDFFQFTGMPSTLIQVDLEGQDTGQGTLPDPFLGFFDSGCNPIAVNDDSGGTLNSRLMLTIPFDGVFILAATSFADFAFTGNGGFSGSYQLSVTSVPLAGSISGRVVDAVSGDPLRGDIAPFATVELHRCFDSECSGFELVNLQSTDSQGRFQFATDFAGNPLTAGTYLVVALADQYQPSQPDPFDIDAGEDRDIGDVPLTPFIIQFSDVQPCADLSVLGGTCDYSVRIRNNDPSARLDGTLWSLVESLSFVGFTQFQTGKNTPVLPLPQRVGLNPGENQVFQFRFQVPGTVLNGTSICTQAFVGQDPNPWFTLVGQGSLFCITKGASGFRVVHEKEARKQFRRLRGQTLRR